MAHSILDNCIGCGACARACPVHAIEGALKSRHAINAKRCIDCGVCGMSCPAGAVLDASGKVCARVPLKERRIPVIDAGLCSAWRLSHALTSAPLRWRARDRPAHRPRSLCIYPVCGVPWPHSLPH